VLSTRGSQLKDGENLTPAFELTQAARFVYLHTASTEVSELSVPKVSGHLVTGEDGQSVRRACFDANVEEFLSLLLSFDETLAEECF